MFNITGIDKLSRDLEDAQRAMSEMDGELGSVSFDPHDPASIDVAIQDAERLFDDRVSSYTSNPIVGQLLQGMKEQYRQEILDKAASARLSGENASGE